jgi:type IV secretory pathway TrbD component
MLLRGSFTLNSVEDLSSYHLRYKLIDHVNENEKILTKMLTRQTMVSLAIYGSMLAVALSLGLPIWLAALVGLVIYVSTGGYAFVKVIIKTFRRDMM